jgi:hypothetical protein
VPRFEPQDAFIFPSSPVSVVRIRCEGKTVRGAESLSSFGHVSGLTGAFAPVFPASSHSPAKNTRHIQMPTKRRAPPRASSPINVAETAKAPLDMTAAVVEATPHSACRPVRKKNHEAGETTGAPMSFKQARRQAFQRLSHP